MATHSIFTLLIISAGFISTAVAQAPTVTPAKIPTSPAETVKPMLERQEIRAQLLPRRYTTIAAEIGAKISRIPVGEGGSFKVGQMLVSFDCSLQQAQLQKAQAELQGATQTHSTNMRLQELNSVGQLEVDLSKAAETKFRAEVNVNRTMLGKCGIAAPFSGRVAEQKAREQQYVQPGQALLDIIDDSVLELEFLVPSRWLSWLRTGGKFQIHIDETQKFYPAKFIRIGARIDPVSQSVKVAAAIDGKFPELIAGMSGRVQVTPP